MKIIIAIGLLFLLFLIYVYIESKILIVRKYKIKNENFNEKLKLIQISDIHNKDGSRLFKKLVCKVKNLSPDFIMITGDLVSRNKTDFSKAAALVKNLCEISPVYLCRGNHELDMPTEKFEKLFKEVTDCGGIYLLDDKTCFEKNGFSVNIYGADLKRSIYRDENNSFKNLEKYSVTELEAALKKAQSPLILMAHNPFCFEEYVKWEADIVFSGHVHGGVINSPVGGILSPERKFFPKFTKGIYKKGNTSMVVSTGIGKLRAFNPSEILYIEIN